MRCVLGNVVQFGCWPYINVVFANSVIASTTLIMSCACNTPTFVVYAAAAVVPSLTKGNQRIADSACMAHASQEGLATDYQSHFHIMTNQITLSGTPLLQTNCAAQARKACAPCASGTMPEGAMQYCQYCQSFALDETLLVHAGRA